jgi:hypothetical protein
LKFYEILFYFQKIINIFKRYSYWRIIKYVNKQIKTEIKPILSDTCGEIFMPRLKKKVNLLNNNKLIWILSGQLYNSPINSFIIFIQIIN